MKHRLYAYLVTPRSNRITGRIVLGIKNCAEPVLLSEVSHYPIGFAMYIDKPKDFEPFGVNINSLVNHTYDEKCNIVFPCMPYVNLYSNSALKKVFSEACKVFAEENSKALGFCLYRYAVDIDVIMQMIAGITNYTDKEVSEFWHDAKNNIRRTRGRIPPEEIAKGYYINFKSGKNYFDNPPTDDLL